MVVKVRFISLVVDVTLHKTTRPVRFAEKPGWKILFVDLVWEKHCTMIAFFSFFLKSKTLLLIRLSKIAGHQTLCELRYIIRIEVHHPVTWSSLETRQPYATIASALLLQFLGHTQILKEINSDISSRRISVIIPPRAESLYSSPSSAILTSEASVSRTTCCSPSVAVILGR
jgi:hypothetical protein